MKGKGDEGREKGQQRREKGERGIEKEIGRKGKGKRKGKKPHTNLHKIVP